MSSNIKYARVCYRENRYSNYDKNDKFSVTGIMERSNDKESIKPRSKNDFDPKKCYYIRQCDCQDFEEKCDDLSKCEEWSLVRGFILCLGSNISIIQN